MNNYRNIDYKLNVVGPECFVRNYWIFNGGLEEAFSNLRRCYIFSTDADLRKRISIAISIIEEGYTRYALNLIIDDIWVPGEVREEAKDLLNALEDANLLEDDNFPEDEVSNTMEMTSPFAYEDQDDSEFDQVLIDMDNVDELKDVDYDEIKDVIREEIYNNKRSNIIDLVSNLNSSPGTLRPVLMDMLIDGEVNCTNGVFSKNWEYALRDNYIFKMINADCEEDESIQLESDPEFEEYLGKQRKSFT